MPLPEISADQMASLHATADRFLAANRVSLMVGLVLTPLLFGAIGVGLWVVIPAPFGLFVGGGILAAGALLMLFLLFYRHRTMSRLPFGAWASIREWRTISGRHGAQTHQVIANVDDARELTPTGWGSPLPSRQGDRTLLLTSAKLTGAAAVGSGALLVCMPTGEVVAIQVADRLVTA